MGGRAFENEKLRLFSLAPAEMLAELFSDGTEPEQTPG